MGYEKNMYFAIEVDEPKWAFRDEKAGLESLAEEEMKVAELGAPRLGEITKLIIRIRESKEFKGTVDKLLKKTNMSLMVGASSWKDQFIEAFSVSAGDDDDLEGRSRSNDCKCIALLPPLPLYFNWCPR